MKIGKILLDTGPLVAFLNKKDQYHEWALSRFADITPPLLTCEPVLSEACFLLRNFDYGATKIMTLVERQLITVAFRLEDELIAIKELLNKYKDLPISLADACLVRMAEQTTGSTVFTLDRDFKIYRKNKRMVLPTIMPEDK